jgi:hypothetical protein
LRMDFSLATSSNARNDPLNMLSLPRLSKQHGSKGAPPRG